MSQLQTVSDTQDDSSTDHDHDWWNDLDRELSLNEHMRMRDEKLRDFIATHDNINGVWNPDVSADHDSLRERREQRRQKRRATLKFNLGEPVYYVTETQRDDADLLTQRPYFGWKDYEWDRENIESHGFTIVDERQCKHQIVFYVTHDEY